jgi:S1-C subfamily serine protease
VNWVDLVILLSAVGAAGFGVVRGGTVQIVSYAGFGAGLLLGAVLAPALTRAMQSPMARSVTGLVLPFALGILLSALGRTLGRQLAGSFRTPEARRLDQAGGAAFGVLVTLVATWLVTGMLAPIGLPHISAAIQQSAIARALIDHLPSSPLALARLQRLVVPTGIPPMLAELEPSPAPDVAVAEEAEVSAAVRAARASTVKIISEGCGRVATGSGFVVADGLVVTNAHVVAGVNRPVVEDRRGDHTATIVLFDPETDLAVLRAPRLAGRPLPLLRTALERGERGAVLGFPAGGPFHTEPGAVLAVFDNLVGRTIYGGPERVSREVYQLKAQIRSGNSGGPFVTPQGQVAGVVFSSSAINGNIGYALTSSGVASLVDRALTLRRAVSSGPCPVDE